MQQGQIIFLNENAGYGFIRPDAQNESDLFFHVTQLPPDTRLGRGDRVSYEAVPDTKKRQAEGGEPATAGAG
jgi:cold shock CspA family protein